MQVTLTKDLKDFVARKVRAGGYANPGEVVREALRDFRTKMTLPKTIRESWPNCCCQQFAGGIVRSPRSILANCGSVRDVSQLALEPAHPTIGLLLGRPAQAGGLVS